jgi:hypothetical protein
VTTRVGQNTERQSVGLPGHCDRCAEVGHVAAHPDLGCADVGCTQSHGSSRVQPDTPRTVDADDLREAAAVMDAMVTRFGNPVYAAKADRLEASANLRPLEDAVLNAALDEFDISNPDLNDVDTYEVLWAAVRALKDAKG